MTKIKLFLWIIIFGLLGLVLYQNRSFFLADQSLGIDLTVFNYQTPRLPIALYIVGMFLAGWVIAYLSGAADRFRSNNQIKRLQKTIHSQQSAIDSMKKDVESLKAKPILEPDTQSEDKPPSSQSEEAPASPNEQDANPV